MSTLANLTNEECALLVEVLETEQKALQSRVGDAQSRKECSHELRRQEILGRLLWHARLGCSTPTPADAELREIGGYA